MMMNVTTMKIVIINDSEDVLGAHVQCRSLSDGQYKPKMNDIDDKDDDKSEDGVELRAE